MKKTAIIILLLLATLNANGLLPLNTSTRDIITDIENISKLFPFSPGSPGETTLLAYITDRFEENQIEYALSDFSAARGYHSFSRIIEADIPGEKEDVLILAIPLSHSVGSIQQGGLNIVTGVQTAVAFSKKPPPVSIKILFLGGEEDNNNSALGTRLFLESYYPDSPVAVLYLNTPDKPGAIKIGTGGKGAVTSRWMIEQSIKALEDTSLDYFALSHETQFFRLGIGKPLQAITLFLNNDLPAVYLNGTEGTIPAEEWIEEFLSFINNFLNNSRQGFPSEVENHYQFFQFLGEARLISESAYIQALFILTMALILYPILARRRFKRYLAMIKKHIWIIPMMVGLVFLFLLLATLFTESILRLQNTPELWKSHPTAFLLLKISGALTLYWVIHKMLKRLPFSRRGNFYSASAILLLIILFIIVCAVNISFSYIILWSLCFAFLFSVFRNKFLKLIFLLGSMAWVVYFALIIFKTPYEEAARFLLFSRWYGNLILTLILLPHIFMTIRLSYLFFIHGKKPRKIMGRLTLLILLLSTFSLGFYLLLSPPFAEEEPQPLVVLHVQDAIDGEHYLSITSPAPFRRNSINLNGEKLPLPSGEGTTLLPSEASGPPRFIQSDSSTFLERRQIKLTFNSLPEKELIKLHLSLTANNDQEFTLLDCNYPYSLRINQKVLVIHLGERPPVPVVVSMVFPEDQSVAAAYEAEFSIPDNLVIQEGKKFWIEQRFLYRESLDLTGEQ